MEAEHNEIHRDPSTVEIYALTANTLDQIRRACDSFGSTPLNLVMFVAIDHTEKMTFIHTGEISLLMNVLDAIERLSYDALGDDEA